MHRKFTIHIDENCPFINELESDNIFKSISTEYIEEYGFEIAYLPDIEFAEDFPNCCNYHISLQNNIKIWFDNFPNCCEEHKNISSRRWFSKEKYLHIPSKILRQLINTEYFIQKQIETDDWYEEITDYIDFNIQSFGIPNIGLNQYLSLTKNHIKKSKYSSTRITKEKKRKLIDYFETLEKNSKSNNKEKDLKLLFSTFQKWQNTFPDLIFFQNLKTNLKNKFPLDIILYEPKFNKYLNLTKYKIKTQTELIEILISITKNLLNSINTTELVKSGSIDIKEKLEIDIISANHKIKQDELLKEFNSTEIKYVTVIRRWLNNESKYFKQINTKLTTMIIKSKKTTVYNNENGNQIINKGNENNIINGNKNDIDIKGIEIEKIKDLLMNLENEIQELNLENKEFIKKEIKETFSKLDGNSAKSSIISRSLSLIYDLLIEVTGAGISPIILKQLSNLIK